MGFLDLLKRKSPLEKAAAQAREPYAQPEYRRAAMDQLLEMGTDEAYRALLQRFTFNAHGQIADEAEKRYLVDQLIHIGEPVLPQLREYLRTEKSLTFAIRALTGILSRDDALAFLIETLETHEPLDHRSTQAKTALVLGIADLAGPEHAKALEPYLEDHHDDVQFQIIVALEKLANEDSRESLCRVCTSDQHSGRIQRRAAQALEHLKWSVRANFPNFSEELKSEFIVGKKGNLVKKQGAKEEDE